MRIDPENDTVSVATLKQFRGDIAEADRHLEAAIAAMEQGKLGILRPVAVGALQRSTASLLSASAYAAKIAKEQQRARQPKPTKETDAAVDAAVAQATPKKRGRPPKKRTE